MRLILIGPPGSGKGTQAKLLCERLGLVHIATGDILREARSLGTPAGLKAKPYMDSGRLVPDDLVNELVADLFRRDNRPDKFVLDGYPRTVAQAASLDAVLRQQFLNIDAVILLLVDEDEIVRRASGRWICPRCQTPYHTTSKPPRVAGLCDLDGEPLVQRPDDREETVRKRLQVYHEQTEGLVPYYRQEGLIREVPAEGDIQTIFQRIIRAAITPPN
jgi:adenylate kinase